VRGQIAHHLRQMAAYPISLGAALRLVDAMAEDPDHPAWAVIGTPAVCQMFMTLTLARLAAEQADTRRHLRGIARARAVRRAAGGGAGTVAS
jgi:hypothetical protein